MLREFEKVNICRDVDRRWVVGSLDVKSLYPSLDIVCGVVVAKALWESDLAFKGLHWLEVALYLAFQIDTDSIECWTELLDVRTVSEWCPRRKHNRRPPEFEASGSHVDRSIRYEPWVFKDDSLEEDVVRIKFCIAIGVMVRRTMELHDFEIDGKVFWQKKGGSIGLDLTRVIADIFMCGWDRMLLERMAKNGMDAIVHQRYKDDVDFVLEIGGDEEETEIGAERD